MSQKNLLLCGYKRSGKDTFYQILAGTAYYSLRIYRSPSAPSWSFSGPYYRYAFADSLKEEVASVYHIPCTIPDHEKEVKQFIHYQTGKPVSARDIYIEYALYKRGQNNNYWAEKISDLLTKNEGTSVITDWRFYNEEMVIKNKHQHVYTARIYRSGVDEPPLSVQSEHELDDAITDYLIVPEGDFENATRRFPQYRDFI
jgi:hypothetical protein